MAFEDIDAAWVAWGAYPLDSAAILPDDPMVEAAQVKLSCIFPADLRHVLQHYGASGFAHTPRLTLPPGCPLGPSFVMEVFLGLGDDPAWDIAALALDTYEGQIPEGWVPIALDPGGNLLLLGSDDVGSRIFAWDHEHSELSQVQVDAAIEQLRDDGVPVEKFDLAQLILLWETRFPYAVAAPTGHGNIYIIADTFTDLVRGGHSARPDV